MVGSNLSGSGDFRLWRRRLRRTRHHRTRHGTHGDGTHPSGSHHRDYFCRPHGRNGDAAVEHHCGLWKCDQPEPRGGGHCAHGSAVNLVVSSGPSQILVPNVVGVPQAAATTAITAVGLTVGTVTQQSSTTVASGNVISQNPAAGGTAPSGSAVNLVVSSGPPQILVPNVVGVPQAAATTAITAVGLTVGTVTQASSGTVPVGSVISQNPTAGTSVSAGTAVNLVVSAAAAYPVSVTVSGLISGASVTVLDNGADSLTFQSNATQQFAVKLAVNAAYSVTVSSQPTLEACTVTGGSGQIIGPVSVSISCSLAPPSTSYPAFVAPYPLILSGQTPANVIPNPRIIPVFFSNTPDQSATLAYLQALVVSPEWSALAEYGVGTPMLAYLST